MDFQNNQGQLLTPEKKLHKEYCSFTTCLIDEQQIEDAQNALNNAIKELDSNKIIQWGQELIERKTIQSDIIKVEFGLQPNQYLQHLQKIIGVVLSRMASFVSKAPQNKEMFENIIVQYAEGIKHLQKPNEQVLKYYLPQLLNASRSLLDDEESAIRSFKYTQNIVCDYQLTKSQIQRFARLFEHFKKLLQTNLFKQSVEQIKLLYNNKLSYCSSENFTRIFEDLQVEFVKFANYEGMVSFQGIFINGNNLEYPGIDKIEALLITLLLHEGMHLVLRRFNNNIFELTPPNELQEKEDLEGGFLLQKILFGDCRKKVWEQPHKILNLDFWDKPPPLYTQSELVSIKNLDIDNFNCSGIFPLRPLGWM